jgi:hypothetical protein
LTLLAFVLLGLTNQSSLPGDGGEREDRGGGHRRRCARHATNDAAVPDAVQERDAVPEEGVSHAVRAHRRQRALTQRPLRRLLLRHRAQQPLPPLRVVHRKAAARPRRPAPPPASGRPQLHGQHGVVARQGPVAQRAAPAPLGVRHPDDARDAALLGAAGQRPVAGAARAAVPVAGQRPAVQLGRAARQVDRVGEGQRLRVHRHRRDRRHHHILLVHGHRQRRHRVMDSTRSGLLHLYVISATRVSTLGFDDNFFLTSTVLCFLVGVLACSSNLSIPCRSGLN